jgi:hypothetical protein
MVFCVFSFSPLCFYLEGESLVLCILCLSFHSSKLPVSTKLECYKHGYILNAES